MLDSPIDFSSRVLLKVDLLPRMHKLIDFIIEDVIFLLIHGAIVL